MKVVIGQGSCGVATGAKKTATEFEKQIADRNLDVKVDITGCVYTLSLSFPEANREVQQNNIPHNSITIIAVLIFLYIIYVARIDNLWIIYSC